MVEIAIGRGSELQCTEVNVIKCLIVDAKRLIRVLHELVDRKGGIVWLLMTVRKSMTMY